MLQQIKRFLKTVLCVSFFAIPAALSHATDPNDYVFREPTSQLLEPILSKLDPKFKEFDSGEGYTFTWKDHEIILVWNKNALVLAAGFGGKKFTLTRINEWNQKRVLTPAYLNSDGGAVISSKLDMTEGITAGTLVGYFKAFTDGVTDFFDFIQ